MMMIIILFIYLMMCERVCSIREVSLDFAEDRETGQSRAFEVEQCRCPPGYRGLSCEVNAVRQ